MNIESNKSFERTDPNRTLQIDQEALNRYKRILLNRVIWSLVFLFVVIIERIFSDYAQYAQNSFVASFQQYFNVNSYNETNTLLSIVSFLDIYRYLILIMTHFYVTFYFGINAVLCMKVLYVHVNSLIFIAFMEILFGDPRPYWSDNEIVSWGCTSSYGFPSFSVFLISLGLLYSRYCYKADMDDEDEPSILERIFWVFLAILIIALCFLKVLSGDANISQVALGLLYSLLVYYVAIVFDKGIDNLVLKSTIQTDSAKRYSIFWMVYLVIIASVGAIFYTTANKFLKIQWFDNYFICLNNRGNQIIAPYYQLIGAWESFLKTSVVYIILGAMFGAAKTFRDMNGAFWYKTSLKKKIIMVIIANIFIIPSWILSILQPSMQATFQNAGVDEYLFYAIHFSLLYFFLFGLVPKGVFEKLGLITSNSGYVHSSEDFLRFSNRSEGK